MQTIMRLGYITGLNRGTPVFESAGKGYRRTRIGAVKARTSEVRSFPQ